MRALCFDSEVVLRDVEPPRPGPGQALLALRVAGICGTDLEVTRGYREYRGTLGHEMVAEVIECPDAPHWVGQRVTGEINLACGDCPRCRSGLAKHCDRRSVLGIADHPGCFAERLTLPFANLHAIPAELSDEQAVFAEPLAAAFEIFESVQLTPNTTVAVIGDGRLGLLIVMALRSRGVPVVAVGHHPAKLARVAGPHVQTSTASALGTERFDVVVEATGSAGGLGLAIAHVKPRGTVVLKSTMHGAVTVDTTRIVVDEIRVVGSRCGPFDVALTALQRGEVDPRCLIDARYPLSAGVDAMAHAARRGIVKVLLHADAPAS